MIEFPLTDEQAIKVMVIEDDQHDVFLFRRFLKIANLEKQIVFCEDGKTALEFIGVHGRKLDETLLAIFLDLRLPSVPGVTVLKTIRELRILDKVPIFVMTSSHDPEDLEECKRLNVKKFIEKPVTFEKFSKVLAEMFHRSMVSTQQG